MEIAFKNIYDDLLELSNVTLQRKLWLNDNNNTGLISSYVELMNRLFDDNDFDNFIDKAAANAGFSSNLILELKRLRYLLNTYNDKKDDGDIIRDPEWKKIINQAKTVVQIWDNELSKK